VTDSKGQPLTPPPEVDLGKATGKRVPKVKRIVPSKNARFNVLRAFFDRGENAAEA
jgi:hypothetical protein